MNRGVTERCWFVNCMVGSPWFCMLVEQLKNVTIIDCWLEYPGLWALSRFPNHQTAQTILGRRLHSLLVVVCSGRLLMIINKHKLMPVVPLKSVCHHCIVELLACASSKQMGINWWFPCWSRKAVVKAKDKWPAFWKAPGSQFLSLQASERRRSEADLQVSRSLF